MEKGELEIQGGIYNLQTGRVDFLGRCPLRHGLVHIIWGLEMAL